MTDWTSFRRIEAVFEGEIPDRVPKYEGSIEIKELNPIANGQKNVFAILFFSPEIISMFHDNPNLLSSIENIFLNPRSILGLLGGSIKKLTKIHRDFNYDMFLAGPGVPMVYSNEIFKDFYTEENNLVVRGPGGRLVWRTSPEGAHDRRGFISKPEEWEKYMNLDADHPANWILVKSTVKECKKLDIVPSFLVFGSAAFEDLCNIFGFNVLFKLLIKNKNFMKKIINQLNEYAIKVGEKIVKEGGNYLYISNDVGLKNKSMISPRMFRELFKPAITSFCERMHELGAKVIMHSCGYVMEMLPDLIDCGIDGLHPIEREAGNDIVKIKQQFGSNLVILGNVPIPLLSHGTPQEVKEYVKFLLKNVSKDGGHVFSSSHSVTQWCKLENFLTCHDTIDQYGNYPIQL